MKLMSAEVILELANKKGWQIQLLSRDCSDKTCVKIGFATIGTLPSTQDSFYRLLQLHFDVIATYLKK